MLNLSLKSMRQTAPTIVSYKSCCIASLGISRLQSSHRLLPCDCFAVSSAFPNRPIILCVDEKELPLKVCREVLSQRGYRVLSAHTGEAALRMFRDNNVDLVISDNRLPDLAGIEIIREMKRLRPTLPVMVLSGLPEVPPGAEAADLFFTKGTSTEAFLAAVAKLLEAKRTPAVRRQVEG